MRKVRRSSLLLLVPAIALQVSCDRRKGPPPPPDAPAASSAPVVDTGPARNEWTGTYDSRPGTLYVPEGAEWKGVRFRGEDAGDGLGAGTMHVVVETDGRAHGDGSGAFGPFLVSGTIEGDVLAFSVLRKDPSDMGFTGTGRGDVTEGKIEGTIRASKATGNVLREATFSLHR